jgi:uncharacterized protein
MAPLGGHLVPAKLHRRPEHVLIPPMPWDFWLIFFVLGVLLPWRGRIRLNNLLQISDVSSRHRLLLYVSTIAFQWFAVAFTAWRASARGLTREQLGLTLHDPVRTAIVAVVGASTFFILQWLNLRRLGRSSGKAHDFMQRLASRILPQSPLELPPYLVLAATAGLCEEFLYRGFAMAALARVGISLGWVVLISSILFGLAHLYQGRGGFVSTFIIGLLF